ncbi:DUF4241 domain-containing protein [uncultured Acetatifactor sp.]|uniref:DUF4241 domain-containing protein n=1 Tax=uncultured Acetatifactor sp. TaxID=1671927 RepID=UPI0034DD1162
MSLPFSAWIQDLPVLRTGRPRRRTGFFEKWTRKNPGKYKYTDYFTALFRKSYGANPEFQNRGRSFLEWELPGNGLKTALFSNGMGMASTAATGGWIQKRRLLVWWRFSFRRPWNIWSPFVQSVCSD